MQLATLFIHPSTLSARAAALSVHADALFVHPTGPVRRLLWLPLHLKHPVHAALLHACAACAPEPAELLAVTTHQVDEHALTPRSLDDAE